MRAYVDTSVIDGIYAQDARIKEITKDFFHAVTLGRFTLYGSEIVAVEIQNTPNTGKRQLLIDVVDEYSIKILPVTGEMKTLASQYVHHKIIPAKYLPDALHIACCAISNIPILLSWNFEHIVKHKTRIEVNLIHKKLNLAEIDICSPEEV